MHFRIEDLLEFGHYRPLSDVLLHARLCCQGCQEDCPALPQRLGLAAAITLLPPPSALELRMVPLRFFAASLFTNFGMEGPM